MRIIEIFHTKELPIYEAILTDKFYLDKVFNPQHELIEDCLAVYANEATTEDIASFLKAYQIITQDFEKAINDIFVLKKHWFVSIGMYKIYYWDADYDNYSQIISQEIEEEERDILPQLKEIVNNYYLKPTIINEKFSNINPRKLDLTKDKPTKITKPKTVKPKKENKTFSLF